MATTSTVHMASFEEGLGRIMFVVGALEHERPFLGPLYRFLTIHPRDSVRRVPPYVSFILRYLAGQITVSDGCIPRVDAQASEVRTGLGGWFPTRGSDGQVSVWESPWFSVEITKADAPWVFEKDNRPSRIISTLEALAVVIALKLRFGQECDGSLTKVSVVPTVTDNRGNGAALNKLMSTRFPSSAILMEMAAYMKRRGLKALVEWAPREFNRESDRLANGITEGFNPARELKVNIRDIVWDVLPAGREAERSYLRARDSGTLPNRGRKQGRRDPQRKLRVVEPW